MKTPLLSLLFFTCITTTVFAQQHRFADSTAEWSILETEYGWTGGGSASTTLFMVKGDTLLQNTTYQVINYSHPHYPLQNNGTCYIRQDSTQKVYGLINADSTEYLMYDFSKVAGDSFTLSTPSLWQTPVRVKVDSTSYLFYGRTRKVMHVTAYSEIINGYTDKFVEGIGSFNSFFLNPGVPTWAIDGPSYNLLCYSEHDTVVYRHPKYSTCAYDTSWTSIDELGNTRIKVWPNPAADVVQVQLQNVSGQPVFGLTDITGRNILQQPLPAPINNIPVNNLSKGVYLYTIRDNNQKISSGKLIVN